MILLLDEKPLDELKRQSDFYSNSLKTEVYPFNSLTQVEFFIQNVSKNNQIPMVLAIDCVACSKKYENQLKNITNNFDGLVIAKVNDFKCGQELVNSKLVDDFYLENEEPTKEISLLSKAIETSKIRKKIKNNIQELKNCLELLKGKDSN